MKALIFDFDGLMVDTEYIWFKIYQDWFREKHQYHLDNETFVMCVGSVDDKMFEYIGKEIGKKISNQEFKKDSLPIFINQTQSMELLPGIKELIQSAHKKGIKIALATSSVLERPTRILKEHNILKYFDVLVTSEDVTQHKPDPQVFNIAIEAMGLEPKDVIIFEDSLNGLIAGNKAGSRVIIVPNRITNVVNFKDYYKKLDSIEAFNLDDYL